MNTRCLASAVLCSALLGGCGGHAPAKSTKDAKPEGGTEKPAAGKTDTPVAPAPAAPGPADTAKSAAATPPVVPAVPVAPATPPPTPAAPATPGALTSSDAIPAGAFDQEFCAGKTIRAWMVLLFSAKKEDVREAIGALESAGPHAKNARPKLEELAKNADADIAKDATEALKKVK